MSSRTWNRASPGAHTPAVCWPTLWVKSEAMSEKRFDDELEEPGDELEEQEDDTPSDGEPWAKTSSGDADDVTSD